jgi:hypothetical protein
MWLDNKVVRTTSESTSIMRAAVLAGTRRFDGPLGLVVRLLPEQLIVVAGEYSHSRTSRIAKPKLGLVPVRRAVVC